MAQTDRNGGFSGDVAIKIPCRVATTTNIAHYGLLTVDGVVLAAGDRVLDKDNTDATLRGIWVASETTWARASDFDGARDITHGTLILITSGNTYANFVFQLTTDNPVIGTSSLTFIDQTPSSLASLAASDGSSLVGFIQSGAGAVARTSQAKMRERVSVNDFGAVGDGIVDDTVAIQAAITTGALKIAGVQGSTYLIDGGLISSTSGQTFDFTGCTIKLKDSATTKWMLKLNGTKSHVIGGTWDGNKANGNSTGSTYDSYCVAMLADYCSCSKMTVSNIFGIGVKGLGNYLLAQENTISGSTHYGIYIDASASTDYRGNKAIGNTIDMSSGGTIGQGILFTASTGQNQLDWELSDNNIIGSQDGGITDAAQCLSVRGKEGLVCNNTTRYGAMGFSEGGANTIITGNRFLALVGSTRYGIETSGGNTIISNNIITNAKQGISASGDINFNLLTITGNTISTDLTANNYGINLQIGTSGTGKQISIVGNKITSFNPIRTIKDITSLMINGNILIGPGSATVNSRGVFLDTPPAAAYVNINNNTFIGFERAYAAYSAGALTVTNLTADNNDLSNDVAASTGGIWNFEGSAVAGVKVRSAGNIDVNGGTKDILDQAANRIVIYSSSYNSPEGNITAGIGSLYASLLTGNTYYIKSTGTGNTGWLAL